MIFYTTDTGCWVLKHHLGNPLYSYHGKKGELSVLTKNRKEYAHKKVFLDSGAFSAFTKGVTVDIDGYIEFCKEFGDCFSAFAALDTIPKKGEMSPDEAAEKSWVDYLYMLKKGVDRNKLIPVFHRGENLQFLKQMVKNKVPYLGIAPIGRNGNARQKIEFIKNAFALLGALQFKGKVHGFGVAAESVMRAFPWHSVDSQFCLQYGVYGKILFIDGRGLNFGVVPVVQTAGGKWFREQNGRSSGVFEKQTRLNCERYRVPYGKIEKEKVTERGIISEWGFRFLYNIHVMHDLLEMWEKKKARTNPSFGLV